VKSFEYPILTGGCDLLVSSFYGRSVGFYWDRRRYPVFTVGWILLGLVRVPSFYSQLDFTGTGVGTQFLQLVGFYWDWCQYPVFMGGWILLGPAFAGT